MAISVESKHLTDGRGHLPPSDSIRTHFPSIEPARTMYPGIERALEGLGGEHLLAVFGYGSSFNGESASSLLDFIVVVDNIAEFHVQNKQNRPSDYPWLVGHPRLQAHLNHLTPNFYPSTLAFDDGERAVKYGVVGYEDFLRQAGDSLGGGAFLYTAGRIQKAGLYPFVRSEDGEKQIQIDQAINQARIDGAWLNLGLLPERFDYEQFALSYINLSYLADFRHEKPGKIKILLDQSQKDYKQMLGDVLKGFIDAGILTQNEDESYEKNVSLRETEVRDLLKRGRRFSTGINFGKNMCFVFGIPRALQYQLEKEKRVHAAVTESNWIPKAPEERNLDKLGAELTDILEGRRVKKS